MRQVRRRAGGRGRDAPAARVHRRRCLPHPQPEGRAGHERLDAGRLQSRLEARGGAARALRAGPAAHLFGGAPGDRQGADRLRSRMGGDRCVRQSETAKALDPAETQDYFVKHGRYTAGTATHYRAVAADRRGDASASRRRVSSIGMRFHSAPVIRLADAKPVHLGHAVKADGRLRIFAFAGAERSRGARLAHPRAVRFPRRGARVARAGSTRPHGRGHRLGDRRPRGVPARRIASSPSRPCPPLLLPRKGATACATTRRCSARISRAARTSSTMRGIDRAAGLRGDRAAGSICRAGAARSTGYRQPRTFFDGFMVPA